MTDLFPIKENTVWAPARRMIAVTPHDTDPIDPLPKALRFDGAGQVTLRCVDDETDVVLNVTAGEILRARVQYVRDTGTDSITIHAAV